MYGVTTTTATKTVAATWICQALILGFFGFSGNPEPAADRAFVWIACDADVLWLLSPGLPGFCFFACDALEITGKRLIDWHSAANVIVVPVHSGRIIGKAPALAATTASAIRDKTFNRLRSALNIGRAAVPAGA